MTETRTLPLNGVRVLEFGHTILGPCCGMILADLGAEVIKIEPPEGLAAARELIKGADVLIENMAPSALTRAGLGPDDAKRINPQLIYCSLKGFLDGPYADRFALDEVVQMMSGLAYMTGPLGMPLRCGTSISDITGGMFGALGILAALRDRERGKGGGTVESALFETASFLMGQFMAYAALTGKPVPPMPARVSAWAVYELFQTLDGQRVFVGVTSDNQWRTFCEEFELPDLLNDISLSTNEMRVDERARLIPELVALFKTLPAEEIETRCLKANLPFARIAHPEDLFDDPHLNANGSLAATVLPGGKEAKLPKLPIRIDGEAFDLRSNPPAAGEHNAAIKR